MATSTAGDICQIKADAVRAIVRFLEEYGPCTARETAARVAKVVGVTPENVVAVWAAAFRACHERNLIEIADERRSRWAAVATGRR